jgi:hypothetical protein
VNKWIKTYKLCFLWLFYCLYHGILHTFVLLSSKILSRHGTLIVLMQHALEIWRWNGRRDLRFGRRSWYLSLPVLHNQSCLTSQVPISCVWQTPSPRIPFDINKWTGMMTLYISVDISILWFIYNLSMRIPVEFSWITRVQCLKGNVMTYKSVF